MEVISKRSKGMVYTLFIIFLIFSVMYSLFYTTQSKKYTRTSIEVIRGEEMNNILKNLGQDMSRASYITTKRALIALINEMVVNGSYVSDPEQALENLTLYGLYEGKEESFMENNTLDDWIEALNIIIGRERMYSNISLMSYSLTQPNPFSLLALSNFSVFLKDDISHAYYRRNISVSTYVDIEGVEDPFITIESYANLKNQIYFCNYTYGSEASGNYFYGIAYKDSVTTDFSSVDKQDKILVTPTLSGKTNYDGFVGYIIEAPETLPYPYVSNLSSTNYNKIQNNTYIAVNNNTIWLTGIDATLHNKDTSCYFPYPQGISFIDRLKGNKTFSPTKGIASLIYIPSLPPELQYSTKDYELDSVYFG